MKNTNRQNILETKEFSLSSMEMIMFKCFNRNIFSIKLLYSFNVVLDWKNSVMSQKDSSGINWISGDIPITGKMYQLSLMTEPRNTSRVWWVRIR